MRFIILIAVVVLALAAGYVTLMLSGERAQPASAPQAAAVSQNAGQVQTVDVLVARNDIPVGTVIDESMVDKQPWPQHLVLNGFVVSGTPESNLAGMVARSDFKAREPIILSRLAKPGDASFLAAGLGKGMRAVTLSVDVVSGVAGYIYPGDRVDVVFTHSVPQEAPGQLWGEQRQNLGSQKQTTSEVLLTALRVLAVNTRQPQQQPQPGQPAPPPAPGSETPSSITLAMTQDEVKRLRLAEKNGTLSLALRALEDESDNAVGQAVSLLDITRVEGAEGDARMLEWRKRLHGGNGGQVMDFGDEVIIVRGVVVEKPVAVAPAKASGGQPAY